MVEFLIKKRESNENYSSKTVSLNQHNSRRHHSSLIRVDSTVNSSRYKCDRCMMSSYAYSYLSAYFLELQHYIFVYMVPIFLPCDANEHTQSENLTLNAWKLR